MEIGPFGGIYTFSAKEEKWVCACAVLYPCFVFLYVFIYILFYFILPFPPYRDRALGAAPVAEDERFFVLENSIFLSNVVIVKYSFLM